MLLIEMAMVFISVVAIVVLGLLTLLKNPNSRTHSTFFFFAVSTAAYNFANYMALISDNASESLFWVRAVMFVALLINYFFFLFTASFPQKRFFISPLVVKLAGLITLVLLPFSFTSLIFESAEAFGSNTVPGALMPAFLIHTITFLGGAFWLLGKRLRKSNGIERSQVKVLLAGSVFMFGAILVTNLLFVLVFKNSDFTRMLPIYTLVFISFISYAISKYRLLNFSMLIARSAAFSLLILLSLGAYSLSLFAIARLFLGETISREVWLISLLLAMFLAFSFESLRRWLGKVTDFLFYKDKYDSNELLYHLSTVMASTLHLTELTKKVLAYLLEEMRLTGGAFIILQDKKIAHITTDGSFSDEEIDDKHIAPLLAFSTISVLDEQVGVVAKEALRKLGASVAVKLQTDKSTIGILLLGEKLSGEVFTSLDTQVISILAPQAAVAFENARAYEEIKRFNITLQDEISKATKSLKVANSELKELDQLKDEFVSIASHELRTPMTAIKDYLWMALAGKGGELTEKQRYYLTRSFSATERLIKLVNDLLNISRIESGRVSLEVEKIDLNQLIVEVIEEVQARATQLNVSLEFVGYSDPVFVVADPDKIKEVLINLIGNSLKFTDAGGTITVARKTVGENIVTSITDSGVGIPAENLKTLFQKFGLIKGSYRTNQAAGQGTGLGLYISRSIIELHRGKIWAESEGTGKGSVFAFTLPKYTKESLALLQKRYADKSDAGIIRSVV